MPIPLSTPAAMSPETKVPWPSGSTDGEPPTKLFASSQLPDELGVLEIGPGVDDRDRDRLERRVRDPGLVEVALGHVPLAWHEGIGRNEREVARAQRLDVADAANVPRATGCRREPRRRARGIGARSRTTRAPRLASASRDGRPARSRLEPDRDAPRRRERRGAPGQRRRPRASDCDERGAAARRQSTATSGETPSTKPRDRRGARPVGAGNDLCLDAERARPVGERLADVDPAAAPEALDVDDRRRAAAAPSRRGRPAPRACRGGPSGPRGRAAPGS